MGIPWLTYAKKFNFFRDCNFDINFFLFSFNSTCNAGQFSLFTINLIVHIYVCYSWPNGWIKLAEFFEANQSGYPAGDIWFKKLYIFEILRQRRELYPKSWCVTKLGWTAGVTMNNNDNISLGNAWHSSKEGWKISLSAIQKCFGWTMSM